MRAKTTRSFIFAAFLMVGPGRAIAQSPDAVPQREMTRHCVETASPLNLFAVAGQGPG